MEILKGGKELKSKPLSKELDTEDVEHKMIRWRMSEFYPFVLKVIENARDKQYLPEIMQQHYSDGTAMSNDEIGEQAKIDFQSSARINSDIYEVLK